MQVILRYSIVALIALVIGFAAGIYAYYYHEYSDSRPVVTPDSLGQSVHYSYISGQKLSATVSPDEIKNSPRWSEGSELPLAPTQAILKARAALPKIPHNVAGWSFNELELSEEPGLGFYFVVHFQPSPPVNSEGLPSNVRMLVYFNGNVSVPKAM